MKRPVSSQPYDIVLDDNERIVLRRPGEPDIPVQDSAKAADSHMNEQARAYALTLEEEIALRDRLRGTMQVENERNHVLLHSITYARDGSDAPQDEAGSMHAGKGPRSTSPVKRRGSAHLTDANAGTLTNATPKSRPVCLAPASRFAAFARAWLDPEAYRLIIYPAIADMHHEYFAHLKNNDEKAAKSAVVRGYVRLAWPFVRAAVKGLIGLFVAARG